VCALSGPDDGRGHTLDAEGIRAYGWKDARTSSTSGSGAVTPFPHTRATSVSLSPELSPANAADPWTTPPMSPFSPITCRDIMQPLLQGAQAGANGHRGLPVHAHAVTQTPVRRPSKRGGASSRSRSLSPDASNFHSPDTLFFRYSPATEVPNLSDKSEVSKGPDKSVNRLEAPTVRAFPAPNDTPDISPKDLNASTFFLDSPISADNRRDGDAGVASGLSWTAAGTLNVEIVQCRNLPQIFGADPCVHCCVSLHESGERSKVNVLSQLENPVREARVHPLSLTAHLLCPQHTTQSAGMSKNLEFRDSFTLERAYALGPVRANRDGEPGLGSVPTLVSLQHRTVDLLITLHNTASQRKDIMSVASLTVTPGAAVDQWFNLFDPDGRRQTDMRGGVSAIRISIYFGDKEIFRRAPSPLLIQDVSPPRDSERRVQENIVADTAPTHANVSGARIIGMPRSNGAAQHVNVKETSLPPPLPSVTENHRLLLKLVTGVQAKMRRTMVSRWYSAMLIRFSKVIARRPSFEVICRLPSLEVKSEVRKPPTALPGGYTELPNLVDAQDSLELQHAARAGRAHMPLAFEPELVHSTRSIEPRVVQTRTVDNQPQQIAGKKDVPETTSNVMDLVLARSWQNLPHGIVHKSTASDTSSLSRTRHHRRSVSPVYSIGPWNDRKFIEAEAFAKLARRLREHGHEEQAQMYCGEAWNLLQQLKAEEDVSGQYNCVAIILNEVERDVSLYASNGSLGSSLNHSLNLDPYGSISTAAGPAATKTNVADFVQNKAAQSSSADARATSAVSPQPKEKDDKRQHREAEVRNSWKKMGKALEDISGALENHVQQVRKSPVQTAPPKDSFKSVRKLPAAEAAAIMRQRLGEPVWSPMPSMNSPSQLTGAQKASTAEAAALMRQRLGESAWSPVSSMDSTSQLTGASTASSKSRSKLMELEETVRLQMRSEQRRSKRKEFEEAANLRRYGDRSASDRNACSELTRKILGMHGDTDVSRTSTDDNASTTGSPESPHDSGVGGGRNGGSGGGERNCMQTLASHGRSPALDEVCMCECVWMCLCTRVRCPGDPQCVSRYIATRNTESYGFGARVPSRS
jgi:uncharacterized FlaG/YvyC family protein